VRKKGGMEKKKKDTKDFSFKVPPNLWREKKREERGGRCWFPLSPKTKRAPSNLFSPLPPSLFHAKMEPDFMADLHCVREKEERREGGRGKTPSPLSSNSFQPPHNEKSNIKPGP